MFNQFISSDADLYLPPVLNAALTISCYFEQKRCFIHIIVFQDNFNFNRELNLVPFAFQIHGMQEFRVDS